MITNPDGYTGTAMPGVNTMSTVTGPIIGSGFGTSRLADLSDGDGIPYGVRFILSNPAFTIEAINGLLTDGGNNGLGIDSSNGGANIDTGTNRLSGSIASGGTGAGADVDEQVRFGPIQFASLTVEDPLGRLQPGAVAGALWRSLRSNDFNEANEGAIVSSDAARTMDVTLFGREDPNGLNAIDNNFTTGALTPATQVYVTTTVGDWRLKGIGFTATVNVEVNPEPNRRIYNFANAGTTGDTTRTITIDGLDVTLTPVGDSAVLGYNNLGVGVLSFGDPDGTGTDPDLRIEGAIGAESASGFRATAESLHFSFSQDVVFESLLLGNVSGGSTEPVILSFVSGTNPLTGLSGYDSGGFSNDGNSITFTRVDDDGELLLPYGVSGRDPIVVEAGTVLGLTSYPSLEGGVLLRAMSANLVSDGLTGDFNGDGTVDAADYVVWRKSDGSAAGYQDWRANFGTTSSDSGRGAGAATAVPEPAGIAVASVALLVVVASRRRRVAAGHRA